MKAALDLQLELYAKNQEAIKADYDSIQVLIAEQNDWIIEVQEADQLQQPKTHLTADDDSHSQKEFTEKLEVFCKALIIVGFILALFTGGICAFFCNRKSLDESSANGHNSKRLPANDIKKRTMEKTAVASKSTK